MIGTLFVVAEVTSIHLPLAFLSSLLLFLALFLLLQFLAYTEDEMDVGSKDSALLLPWKCARYVVIL